MNYEDLENALQDSLNFTDYITYLEDLTNKNRTTGNFQSEKNVQFTKLNIKRLQRIYKIFKVQQDVKQILNNISNKQIWLTLSEGWCGDAAQSLPVMAKMADENKNIKFLITSRDRHPELMNNFLTDGTKAIPIVILLNKKLELLGNWGPRPVDAHKLTTHYKTQKEDSEQYHIKLQNWYNKDRGMSIQNELKEILNSF